MKKVRKGISDDFDYFKSLLEEPLFKKKIGDLVRDDDSLKGIPKGFEPNNEVTKYLQLKRFYVQRAIPKDKLTTELLVPYITFTFKIIQPIEQILE